MLSILDLCWILAYTTGHHRLNAQQVHLPTTTTKLNCLFNPLTAMKKVPTPGVFWSKSNFFKIIYTRDKINIPAAPDISGTWRLRVELKVDVFS